MGSGDGSLNQTTMSSGWSLEGGRVSQARRALRPTSPEENVSNTVDGCDEDDEDGAGSGEGHAGDESESAATKVAGNSIYDSAPRQLSPKIHGVWQRRRERELPAGEPGGPQAPVRVEDIMRQTFDKTL
jgi:hypothetical protein